MFPQRQVTSSARGLELPAHRQAGTPRWATAAWTFKWHQPTKHVFLYSRPSLSSQQPKLNHIGPCQRPGRRALQAALAHTASCSAQFWGSWTQRGSSGNGGRLNNTLLVREGRMVLSAKCTQQLFSTSASSNPAIGHKTFCFTSVFFWEWHDTKQSPIVLQGQEKKKRVRKKCTACLFLHLTIAKH